ncbi:MAG: Coq4 family protein [Pseudomonadota bacterium]
MTMPQDTKGPTQASVDQRARPGSTEPRVNGRLQPLTAFRALRRLIADPERTEEVFVVIRALSGTSLEQGYARFRATALGQRVLAEQRVLIDRLTDRTALRALPADSLGRAYLTFVEREGITAEGLVEASDHESLIADPGLLLFSQRQRDMHDLWHVTTGYGRDTFGEVCLLAFTYAQTRNRGLGVIALAGLAKHLRPMGWGVLSAFITAYRAGKRARWLPAEDWELLLTRPLDEVRTTLGISDPVRYRSLIAQAAPAY